MIMWSALIDDLGNAFFYLATIAIFVLAYLKVLRKITVHDLAMGNLCGELNVRHRRLLIKAWRQEKFIGILSDKVAALETTQKESKKDESTN